MMESSPDWKAVLTASERFETIQKMRGALGPVANEAVAIEQRAYQNATTRDEYDFACQPVTKDKDTHHEQPSLLIPRPYGAPETGIRIGPYQNCTPIADGVTSEVYRHKDKALKVIVTQHPFEPHSPQREVKILGTLRPPCIPLLDVFRDQEQRLVLVFPLMPFTLAELLGQGSLSTAQVRSIFTDTLQALTSIHAEGIIHRDIKPSAILLSSPSGPAFLSDFGTAWHPSLSIHAEQATQKILDIGTGPYRAPEVLFADKSYGPPVDMWGLGVMLAEAIRSPPASPFESRSAHEDGNQLGLILSIFKTLGTPTPESWPEAKEFRVSPFELWTMFAPRSWDELLPDVDPAFREVVGALVRYDGSRATAEQTLRFGCFASPDQK